MPRADRSVTYLTVDSVQEGVGVSQVLPYVLGLADRGWQLRLHTFERRRPDAGTEALLRDAGVRWTAHSFGRQGAAGGLGRVARAAGAVPRRGLVHARSDLPAASALLGRSEAFVWDVRAFWAEQRIALGAMRRGSAEHRVMQRVERQAALRSAGIVTLTDAARADLGVRFGGAVSGKTRVITTCVDLVRFAPTPMPPWPLQLLLSGTLNTFYDVPTMVRLTEAVRRRTAVTLTALSPPGPWDGRLAAVGAQRTWLPHDDVPARVAASHAGLAVCRFDGGPSLRAAMPTKVGEFLASGRPVVVNAGLGDLPALLADARAGVVLTDPSEAAVERAAETLVELVSDPDVGDRCRGLAEQHFSLEKGVSALAALYDGLAP